MSSSSEFPGDYHELHVLCNGATSFPKNAIFQVRVECKNKECGSEMSRILQCNEICQTMFAAFQKRASDIKAIGKYIFLFMYLYRCDSIIAI